MKQTKRAGAAIAILLLMAARAQAQTISGTADIDTVSNEIRVKIDPVQVYCDKCPCRDRKGADGNGS